MEALSIERLTGIAQNRGIAYEAPEDEVGSGRRIVKTTIAREFAIPQADAFNTFSDPQAHVRFFTIIKQSTPLIPLEGALKPDEYVVLEHVQEANLPPRMMVVKYTLRPPDTIIKEAVTDPFGAANVDSDRKRGLVTMRFERTTATTTRVTCSSTFETNDGPVFVRGFIDHVWLNFFERLMVETGEIGPADMLTVA